MKTRLLRAAVIAPLLLGLQGCFFIWIPGSVLGKAGDKIAGVKGEHCVHGAAKVGDTITLPGNGRGRVVSLHGENWRCKNPAYPIRAELDLEPVGVDRPIQPVRDPATNPEAIRPTATPS